MAKLSINDFSGGLRTDVAQNLIADNESPAMQNVWTREKGTLTKRRGIIRKLTTSGQIGSSSNLIVPKLSTSSINNQFAILVNSHANGGTKYIMPLTGNSPNGYAFGTATSLGTTGYPGSRILTYNTRWYINVGDGIYTYTTAGVKTLISTIKAFNICFFKDILFLGGCSGMSGDNTSRLRWSSLGDPAQYPTNNFTDIGLGDGANITGMCVYNDSLFVFKGPRVTDSTTQPSQSGSYTAGAIWQLNGEPLGLSTGTSYTKTKLNLPIGLGTIYGETVNIWQNMMVFCTNNGVYGYDGNSFVNLTEKIKGNTDIWNKYRTGGLTTNTSRIEFFTAVYKDWLYITVNESTTDRTESSDDDNRIYVFGTDGSIWRWTNKLNVTSIAVGLDEDLMWAGIAISSSPPAELSDTICIGVVSNEDLDRETGSVGAYYDTTAVSSDGSAVAIEASYTTKEFDLKSPVHIKYLTVDFRAQTSGILGIEFNVDQKGWVKRTVDMSSSVSDIRRSQRLLIGLQGRTIQLRFSNNQAYTNFEIYSADVEYAPLHDAGEINAAKAINTMSNS